MRGNAQVMIFEKSNEIGGTQVPIIFLRVKACANHVSSTAGVRIPIREFPSYHPVRSAKKLRPLRVGANNEFSNFQWCWLRCSHFVVLLQLAPGH